ncbi:MAG: hypothetical protein ABRQ39_02935 [Candidatus Eremiobacterota bacterium]
MLMLRSVIRIDSLGDNVLFSFILPHIREYFKGWEITLTCRENVTPIYASCPFVDEVTCINGCYKKDYDLAVNPVYSRTILSDSLTFESGAKKL